MISYVHKKRLNNIHLYYLLIVLECDNSKKCFTCITVFLCQNYFHTNKYFLSISQRPASFFFRQLSQKRTFTSASAHCPAVNSLSGLTSLDQFQEVDKLDAYTEELKKCGLTDEEIQLKMMADDSHKVKRH